ncbi:23S rRNA (guanosine(2251)-2'-O)-methyltransferase RlmB [Oceanibaculum pacificum]|uniref:Pseudouridine synthase n=1 Tax=Oceanibaculum pacificum TaxID=580166 RepID=A0A154VU09_9PROT|nr:23S rRNA (guanosine(2251)-2'-O)-methyltransferase RlmB [Oceanibaculum pacificum]KZD04691.1 pseudouridine synthase [Oceanibaculum pacificum]
MSSKRNRPGRDARPAQPHRGPAPARRPDSPDRGDGRGDGRADGRGDGRGDGPGRGARGAMRGTGDPARFVWGVHAVRAALDNPRRKAKRLLMTAQARETMGALPAGLPVDIVERAQIDSLFPDAVHQGLALQVEPLADLDLGDIVEAVGPADPLLLVVLDQVTDPHNVGAILRSAAAFGAAGLVVQDRHSPAATGTLAKSASGALDLVPIVRVTNLARALDQMKAAGLFCIGFDSEAPAALQQIEPGNRVALVMGAEGPGLRRLTRERCDALARLPTAGPIASLNVSNATAIALYDMARRRDS